MPRPEKTVFISYRRKDISWALAVYHYLTKHDYDVFFDYKSIPSGDFEQIIIGNIKARAHFLVILTPTALDRTDEPGDWLRREIETAISERRNIIPLFFDGFNFGAQAISKKLTGKLGQLKRYNGLDVPAGYFDEAMDRLRGRYLNVTLDAVLHPVSEEVEKAVKEQQVAANQAISSKDELKEKARKEKEAQERARIAAELKAKKEQEEKERRLAEEKSRKDEQQARRAAYERIRKRVVETLSGMLATGKGFFQKINPRQFGIGGIVVLTLFILFYGGNYISQNLPVSNAPDVTNTPTITPFTTPTITPTNIVTIAPTNTIAVTFTVTPSPTSVFNVGDTMISDVDGMTMVYVPAGEFTMGSENGGNNEKPIHKVDVDSFWIDQTEVTNTMYETCVENGECDMPSSPLSYSGDYYYGNAKFDNYPVINVSWNDAASYCTWSKRRLPTEAEWEKAASWDEKNRQKFVYPWGNDFFGSILNFCDKNCQFAHADNNSDDSYSYTSPVGNYIDGASPYGVLNMAGNVSEWVSNWSYSYSDLPISNPTGPDTGSYRMVRGGAWNSGEYHARSSYRIGYIPTNVSPLRGFRCAMDAE